MTTIEVPATTTSNSSATAERIIYDKVEDFVAHVIYDGCFLESFSEDPEYVADRLGVGLDPGVAQALRGRDRGAVLAEVTEKLTREHAERTVTSVTRPTIYADFGISTAVVVGAIAVGVIVVAVCGHTEIVTDNSADADRKL